MKRYLSSFIQKDLEKKIVLMSGPRQVGKTTLAKSILPEFEYLNWDNLDDRSLILSRKWDRSFPLLILDELHKMTKFKSWLKGIYDKEGVRPRLLVTGSARLDTIRKVGDSLAGRFFPHRLHPLDLWELKNFGDSSDFDAPKIYEQMKACSGFPEPYFEGSPNYYQRWSRTHLDLILRQDLLSLESVRDIGSLETMISLLQTRVGSTVSARSLSIDLQKDPKTIQRWLGLLENLFVIFRVSPYHRNLARALTKEPKFYFFDLARVYSKDEGPTLENFVALALKKRLDYLADTQGIFGTLSFLRTRDQEEVDFFIHWSHPQQYAPLPL